MVLKLYFLLHLESERLDLGPINWVFKTRFLWSDHAWCGIFSMWWSHRNQVSKTRFITLISKNTAEKNHQNIREEPREKKKKLETKRERRSRSKWVALGRLQTTVRNPGRPPPRETQAALVRWALSLPLLWVSRIGIVVFGIS